MKAIKQYVTLPGGYSIEAVQFQIKAFDAPWHVHSFNELTYIVSSRGLRYVGNQVNPFDAGDFVLIKGNVPHCWKNSDDNQEIAHAIVIQWEDEIFSALPEFEEIRRLLERSRRGVKFEHSSFFGLEPKLFELIHSEPLQRYVLFLDLLKELCNSKNYHFICTNSFDREFNIKTNLRLEKVLTFVESNYHRKINLAELSGLCNMTEESFSRFFSKSLKKSFFSYVNEYRINAACKQLVETDLSISEIAYLNGFGSLAFFHRQFNKYKNVTPSHYRNLFSNNII